MTLREAIKQGIVAVRQDPWNPYCRMALDKIDEEGSLGPWGHIIDPCGNSALGNDPEKPIDILLLNVKFQISADPDADEWESWVRPPDYDAKFGKAAA